MQILSNLNNLDKISDGDTYKKVSSTEKTTWNNKLDATEYVNITETSGTLDADTYAILSDETKNVVVVYDNNHLNRIQKKSGYVRYAMTRNVNTNQNKTITFLCYSSNYSYSIVDKTEYVFQTTGTGLTFANNQLDLVPGDIDLSLCDNTTSGFLTEHQSLANYSLITETGNKIDLSIDSSTYVVTLNLKDKNNNILSTDTIDLPLESVVVSGRYDSATKKVILTLQSGSTIEFSVADLVSGLQSEITSTNKLSSDLVDDTNKTNKFVTASEKTTWSGKQDAITSSNKLAYSLISGTPTIPSKTSDLTNDSGFLTSHQDISGKENTSNKSSSYTTSSTTTYPNTKALVDGLGTKQATLVSGTNIKTINNNSILGSGNISISGGAVDGTTTRLNSDNETEVIGIYTTDNDSRKIWEGTLAEYNAITTKDSDTYYYITDDGVISYNDLADKPTIPQGTVTSVTAGTGLSGGTITSTGTIALNAAASSTLGGLKVRLDGTTLYIRNDGSDA